MARQRTQIEIVQRLKAIRMAEIIEESAYMEQRIIKENVKRKFLGTT